MDFIAILRYIGPLSILIPLILGLINYHNLKLELKVILFLIVFIGLFDIMLFLSNYAFPSNELITKTFTLVEYAFIGIFYVLTLRNYFRIKKLIIISSILLGVLFINSFILKNSNTIDSFSRSLECVVFIFTGLTYAYKSSYNSDNANVEKSLAVINVAFLLYFSLTFFIFLFGDVLVKHPTVFSNIWMVNALLSIITNLLFAYSLWTAQIRTK